MFPANRKILGEYSWEGNNKKDSFVAQIINLCYVEQIHLKMFNFQELNSKKYKKVIGELNEYN